MSSTTLIQKIYKQVQDLPPESLLELDNFIEFLRFKAQASRADDQVVPSLRIIKLGGILRGYDFSPELLAEARREMWKKFRGDRP